MLGFKCEMNEFVLPQYVNFFGVLCFLLIVLKNFNASKDFPVTDLGITIVRTAKMIRK